MRRTIATCVDNADRLLEETYDLEFREVVATRFFMIMVAQEECAKAFLLFLVMQGIIPFSAAVRRAMIDHTCKQLVGMVMDYVIMHWEHPEEYLKMLDADYELGERMPNDVGSAIEILRYVKVGGWQGEYWGMEADPPYDAAAVSVVEGKKDRRKQDALYVRIGADGSVASTPSAITDAEREAEFERAGRYCRFVRDLLVGEAGNTRRMTKTLDVIGRLFAPAREEPA